MTIRSPMILPDGNRNPGGSTGPTRDADWSRTMLNPSFTRPMRCNSRCTSRKLKLEYRQIYSVGDGELEMESFSDFSCLIFGAGIARLEGIERLRLETLETVATEAWDGIRPSSLRVWLPPSGNDSPEDACEAEVVVVHSKSPAAFNSELESVG